MADSALHFADEDFEGALPPEGVYAAVIERARFHTSRQGNTTLQVTCGIEGVDEDIADYFVLSGASGRGRAVSRRRLIELYRACGFNPQPGDTIRPEELSGCRVEVELGHETYEGRPRLRVLNYRALP
jgi:hypothetical protein